jgi:ParB family chromosome partitioning protein
VTRERRLGKGLEALLGRAGETPPPESQAAITGCDDLPEGTFTRDDSGQMWLDIYTIDRNPYQPREDFSDAAIESLKASIQEHGVLQPLVVRRQENRFQLITGERRLRAATAAGWTRVPVQVREADDRQMAELAIVENVQRKDLNPLEKAGSFQRYIQQYGCTQEELAARVKIDRSTVANLIRLLELPDDVKRLLIDGKLTQGHARALLPLGDEREQIEFAMRIQRESLTVRNTEEEVQRRIRETDTETLGVVAADGTTRRVARTRGAQLESLEEELRVALGTKVDLKQTAKGRGRVVIHFKNHEEFERIRAMLVDGAPAGQTEAA